MAETHRHLCVCVFLFFLFTLLHLSRVVVRRFLSKFGRMFYLRNSCVPPPQPQWLVPSAFLCVW